MKVQEQSIYDIMQKLSHLSNICHMFIILDKLIISQFVNIETVEFVKCGVWF
jgi:hypothetical protein